MENRIAIFIDGSNLYHALRNNLKRHDLNFADFTARLCGSRPLFRIYYYNVLQDQAQWPEGYREQQEFLAIHPDGYRLGQELGTETGQIERHRAFYIIDRSIPVGFQRGEDLNVEDTILLRRFIE